MEKLRRAGTPLGQYVDGRFFYGIKTGLNEAFVVDGATRDRLVAEDPASAELLKPWLRGRDIRKWKAEWAGLYLIAVASSANRTWPWSGAPGEAEARTTFAAAYPAVHRHLSQWEDSLRNRDDQGRYWWELRSCAYWEEFERPKISWCHFTTAPIFIYDEDGYYSNDKSYILPTEDLSLLAILNSRITGYFIRRISPPVQGGFLEMRKIYLETLPIPAASPEAKAALAAHVRAILADPSVTGGAGEGGERREVERSREDSPHGVNDSRPSLRGVLRFPSEPRPEPPPRGGASPQGGAGRAGEEEEIDRIVYGLYGLTEGEIALVEGATARPGR